MSGIQCEICGGQIEMQSGGSKGICVQCGITYSADRVREMYSGKRTPVTSGGNAAYTEFDIRDGVLVKYNGRKEKVVVPYGVKRIGERAFLDNICVKEVVLADTVSMIDWGAFKGTKSLKKINLTDRIKEIGESAFSGAALESVTIPPVIKLGEFTFCGCSSLVSVVFLAGVEEIGSYAFSGCGNLSNLILPDTIKCIESHAFEMCEKLNTLTFPDTLEIIGAEAFHGCKNLTGVNLNKNIKHIGMSAFSECGIEWLRIMSKEISLAWNAFGKCNKLSSVTITGKITYYGGDLCNLHTLFTECENVKEVTCEENYVEELFGSNNNIERLNGEIYASKSKKMQRRQAYTCQYCGGTFKGVFSKVCSQCGKPKDY